VDIDSTTRQEGDTALRVGGLVFTKVLELIVLVFVVSNVSVALSSKVKAVGAVIPERHADTGNGVQHGEAANGLCPAGLPETDLTLAHP
jgi:hypothetical protein